MKNQYLWAESIKPHPLRGRSGVALLVTLLMLSLITIIVVALLGTMTWEISATRKNYDAQKARSMAVLGMNMAAAQLRYGLGPWDKPYANFATNPPPYFWSISPGLLTQWSYSSVTPLAAIPLFSSGTASLVNLNAVQSDGTYPIAGGANPPNISVYWANVLQNPAVTTPSAVNPIVGRYAFWVDDENAKININTADGTMKYQTNSLGLGSPSEVSLQVLQSDPTLPTPATNIVYLARTAGFNSEREILRATNATPDLYTNNVFNITAYGRSPDLNIFGQPKMLMTPLLGDISTTADLATNSITLQPAREIYPTPSQLPPYVIASPSGLDPSGTYFTWFPATTFAPVADPYPLAFRGQDGLDNEGENLSMSPGDGSDYVFAGFSWINGMILAKYLSGTNAANQAITWPAFSGTTSTSFAGKYTARQIDSIVAQIASLGAKDISPDVPYATYAGYTPPYAYTYEWYYRGLRTITTPLIFNGWLSHQPVTGMGRVPKVDAMEMAFTTYGSVLQPGDPNYKPPTTSLNIWQEWWLPAAYLGGNNILPINNTFGSGLGSINYGEATDRGVLNVMDMAQSTVLTPIPPPPTYPYPGAALPKADNVSTNYWGNQLLASDQGIDFQAIPSSFDDPDQAGAALYHPTQLNKSSPGKYGGSGDPNLVKTPFLMVPPQAAYPAQDWLPGEVRCVESQYGGYPLMMQTNAGSAANPTLTISGGIQTRAEIKANTPSDLDPVPLDSIRGAGNPPPYTAVAYGMSDFEWWNDPAKIPPHSTALSVRQRFMQAVIPVNFTMPIPANSSDGSIPGNTEYVVATVFDPLVNKFPKDWNITQSSSPISVPAYWASATSSLPSTNSEFGSGLRTGFSATINGIQGDPDSYWIPQADCAVSYLGDLDSQILIPRSARFPNIGYLQYLRTGIMPDDDGVPLPAQHGTPFRLLDFSPSTDTSQKTTLGTSLSYPDWALLDLVYVPSLLASYGSPYGYFNTNSVWQGYGDSSVLANFSTRGGSTPGRINPNGAVIYTTNTSIPQSDVSRIVPLRGLVHGLMVDQHLTQTGNLTGGTAVDDSISESDANSIPVAIERYIRANGPLRMPEEICNVPEIAALHSSVNVTRNDLVRQIMGNLTTQSNTFSIWVAGESIVKSKGNTNYGIFESGDQISASVRYHFIMERYLDPGSDGSYGNANNAGTDGIVGTYDDPVNSFNHPFQPRYLYRVVSAEEIR